MQNKSSMRHSPSKKSKISAKLEINLHILLREFMGIRR